MRTNPQRKGNGRFLPQSNKALGGESVKGMALTNRNECFWLTLKCDYVGTYHKMSAQHLGRYINEFVGRLNPREMDTIEQMIAMTLSKRGMRLQYRELVR